jgi:methoxymalonate biosynthesis acyl carrier protein
VQPAEKIREFIRMNLAVYDDGVVFGDDDNIFALGFVDSPFAIQLICFIEEEFRVKVADDDLDIENFNTVNRVIEFIRRKKGL